MFRKLLWAILFAYPNLAFCQQKLAPLTVDKIMRDPKWIGTSPSNPYWSEDGKYLLFNWNPEASVSDSVYYVTASNLTPIKTSYSFRNELVRANSVQFNANRSAIVYLVGGDIILKDLKTGNKKKILQTNASELNPQFAFNDTRIVYASGSNLYSWDIGSGQISQLTNFESGSGSFSRTGQGQTAARSRATDSRTQEGYLKENALENSDVLTLRKSKRDLADSLRKFYPQEKRLRTISIDDRSVFGLNISPDGRFITYRLIRPATGGKSTIVPVYVTETGYTEDLSSRTKVGSPQGSQELFVFDTKNDTVIPVKTDSVLGIRDLPDYIKDYPKQFEQRSKNPVTRSVSYAGPFWSPKGNFAVVDMRAQDNKDRWIMLLNPATGKLKLLDRQRDEAWIAGPGISSFGGNNYGWINENTFWFQSEATGYSHLYTINVETGEKKALTGGKYEVLQSTLSNDKKFFYIVTNEIHPGEQHLYRLPATGGKAEQLTSMKGANQVTLSPDEKYIAVINSYSNRPWELYLQENKPNGKITQVTFKSQSEEFKSYPWRDPEVITFQARDGANVYARLYKPANPDPLKPAVIFVHGAGYLQNAHKWWSSYFREYMFNNLLADKGYHVLDIDYRGSAGYGRDWRTGIYRYMGDKDLTDHIDGINYLVRNFGVDPKRIGVYGGSYGGFITLMAMFTAPDSFAAGAALRPVTDWAHYNHGYTSNILNEPTNDSIAYRRSSPIYFANGLKGHLLICHGMADVNVHFQDAVRLSQRLIELGKDNWEFAPYPVEDHGFVEPSSWTDEYKRILKLFEDVLKSTGNRPQQ
jgi:dipeptidyl aminopeptidase/acylaminoacyl peptidase